MTRKLAPFRQIDVTRAVRASKNAGCEVARVEIDPITGKIVIITVAATSQQPANALDEWEAKRARSA